MCIRDRSYTFFALIPDETGTGSWQVFEDERLRFEKPDFKVEFGVEISGLPIVLDELDAELEAESDDDPIRPHVMFLSNGEMVPDFRVLMEDEEGEFQHAVFAGEVLPVELEAIQ